MSWDEAAATWDEDPAVRTYAEAAFERLERLLAERACCLAGLRVLDFGSGTGLLTARMANEGALVTALDLSGPMIDVLRAKELENVTALAGSLEDHALGTFELVTCSSVLAFVEDPASTVAALAQHLAPGGWFVQLDWELDPTAVEPFGLTREAIRSALVGAGLEEVLVEVGFEAPFEGMVMRPLLGVGRRS